MGGDVKAGILLTAARAIGAEAAFKSFQADIDRIGARAKIAATAAVAAFALIEQKAFASNDALAKQSDQLGISTKNLAGLRLGASLAGVDTEQLTKALEKQRQTVFGASEGVAGAARALDILGLKANELIKLDTHAQFLAIADAMNKVENSTQRGALAAEVFGARNQELINLIAEGSGQLQDYTTQAENLGLAVSRVDAAKIEQANDAVEIARKKFEGLSNLIAVQLAPAVTALANNFTEATGNAKDMDRAARVAVDGIARSVGVVADIWYGWNLLIAQSRVLLTELFADFKEFDSSLANTGFGGQVRDLVSRVLPGIGGQLQTAADQNIREAAAARETAKYFQEQRDALIASGAPSERIAAALANARIEAQAAAEQVAKTASKRISDAGAPTVGGDSDAERKKKEAADRAAAQAREKAQRELQSVQAVLSEGFEAELEARKEFGQLSLQQETELRQRIEEQRRDVELSALQNRLEMLRGAREQNLIDDQKFAELSIKISQQTQERLTGITKKGLTERQKFELQSARVKTQTVLGELVDLTAGVAQQNKTLFKINKAAALAQAAIDLPATAISAFKFGTAAGGPVVGAAMAAVAVAAQLAQIQAIRSTSFEGGGGGTTPSDAGSTPTVNGEPANAPGLAGRASARGQVIVDLSGAQLIGLGGIGGLEALGELLGKVISRNVNDRDVVIISRNSAQAREIRGGS